MNTNNENKRKKRKYESGALKRNKKNKEALFQCANDKKQTKINFFSQNNLQGKLINN